MMKEFRAYPPEGRILHPTAELAVNLRGKQRLVKTAATDLFYLGTWPHMHSPEMLLALATLAEQLLQGDEKIVSVSRANFNTLVTSNLKLFAARNAHLTPKLLGSDGNKRLAGEFATSAGDFIHVIGIPNGTPVEKHVAFNPLVAALSVGFNGCTRNGDTLSFPISPNRAMSSEIPFMGLSAAHELLIRTWHHGLRELLPNGGFAWQVNYAPIPTLAQLFACEKLVLHSENWEGSAIRDDFKVVDIGFHFLRSENTVSSGTYRHLHPDSSADRERTLREAGITSF